MSVSGSEYLTIEFGIFHDNDNCVHCLPFLPPVYVVRQEGNVFTGISLSVHRGEGVPQGRICLDRLCRRRYASCGFPQEDFLVVSFVWSEKRL